MTIPVRPLRLVAVLAVATTAALWNGPPRPLLEGAIAGPAYAQAAPATGTAQEPTLDVARLCMGCHSPADGAPLSGALTGRWLSPNITPDRVSGIGAWSREELFNYLRSGQAPGRGQAGGPMAAVVEALQDSSDAELNALLDWLLQQPGHRDPADQMPASEWGKKLTLDPAVIRSGPAGAPDQLGATLYNAACASCHGADGAGSHEGYFPSMFHDSSVGRRTPYNLVAALLSGIDRHLRDSAVLMQSFDGAQGVPGGLSDGELAAVSNYVLRTFGDPAAAAVTKEGIAQSRLAWWGVGEPTAARGQLIVVGGGPGGAGAACFNCHGLKGQGDAGSGSPRLAGLDVSYFAKQMRDYASGSRPHGAMSPIAQQLDDVDHHSLALYYASLSPAPPVQVSSPQRSVLQAGRALYDRGAPTRGVPACATCHGAAGRGFGPIYPSVAQPLSYIAGQLRLWRDGTRHNDTHDLMGAASRKLSDEDIQAVAAYAAGLTP